MKVTNDKNPNLLDNVIKTQSNKTQKDNFVPGRANNELSDKVELSSRKQNATSLKEKAMAASVVRQDKIDQIREAIRTETYNIKGELVAKSIIKSNLLDEIF